MSKIRLESQMSAQMLDRDIFGGDPISKRSGRHPKSAIPCSSEYTEEIVKNCTRVLFLKLGMAKCCVFGSFIENV